MVTIGTILKLQTKDTGTIFYRINEANESSFTIIPLCRVRKGYLTIKYQSGVGTHIYKSQVGVHYLETTKKELSKIRDILQDSVNNIDQANTG